MSAVVVVCWLLCSSIPKLLLHFNTFILCLFLLEEDQLFSLAQLWPTNRIIFPNEAGVKVPKLSIYVLFSCLRAAHSGYDVTVEARRLGCVSTRISQSGRPTKICGGMKTITEQEQPPLTALL